MHRLPLAWLLAALVLAGLLLLLLALCREGVPQRPRLARGLHCPAPMTRPPRRDWGLVALVLWALLTYAVLYLLRYASEGGGPLQRRPRRAPPALARVLRSHPAVDRDWLPWVVALLVLLLAAAFLALLLLPLGPTQGRLARGLHRTAPMHRPRWLTWALALLLAAALAAFLLWERVPVVG